MNLTLLEDYWNIPAKNGEQSFITVENFEKYSWSHAKKYNHLIERDLKKTENKNQTKRSQTKADKSSGNLTQLKATITTATTHQNFQRKWGFPQPEVPYPKLSSLTKEEHYEYVEKYMWFIKMRAHNKSISNTDPKFQSLHKRVIKEQEEFQGFARMAANKSLHRYNLIHPDADVYIKDLLKNHFRRVYHYPRYYSQLNTIPLLSMSTDEVKFVHIKSLLEMGKMPAVLLPTLKIKTKLPMTYAKIIQRYPISESKACQENKKILHKKPVSEDSNAELLAKKYQANAVISSSGIKKLMDNILTSTDSSWEMPVVVKEYEDSGNNPCGAKQKIVFVDKPFPKKNSTYCERSIWYHKFALKCFLCHPRHTKVRQIDTNISKMASQVPSNSEQDVEDDIFQSQDDLYELETFGTESSFKKPGPKKRSEVIQDEQPEKKENGSKTNADKNENLNDKKHNDNECNIIDYKSPCTKAPVNDSESKVNSTASEGNNEENSESNCKKTSEPEALKTTSESESLKSEEFKISTFIDDSDSDSERLVIDTDNFQSPPQKRLKNSSNEHKEKNKTSKAPKSKIRKMTKGVRTAVSSNEICRYSLRSRSHKQNAESSDKMSDEENLRKNLNLSNRSSKSSRKKMSKEELSTDENSTDLPESSEKPVSVSQKRSRAPSNDKVTDEETFKCTFPNKPTSKDLNLMKDVFGSSSSDEERELHESVIPNANVSLLESSNTSDKHKNVNPEITKSVAHSTHGVPGKRSVSKETSKIKKNSTLDEILEMQEKMLGTKTESHHGRQFFQESNYNDSKCLNIEMAEMYGLDPVLLLENEDPENYLPPNSDCNVTYNLWCLNKLRLIIRNSVNGQISVDYPFKMNQHCYLYPKLEYQSTYGGEAMTASENIKLWIATLIRRNAKAVRVRIDALTSEILSVENMDLNQIVPTTGFGCFNPESAAQLFHNILMKLISLSPGNYLLIRSKGEGFIKLLMQTDSSKGGAYDLHSSFNYVLNENPVPCKNPPWNPLDPTIYFKHHKVLHKIPATFEMKGKTPRGRPPNKTFNKKKKKNKKTNKNENQKTRKPKK